MTAIAIPVHSGRRDRTPVLVASVLVDPVDAAWASRHYWTLSQGYAVRRTDKPENQKLWMHREILGLAPGDPRRVTDHVNRNKLDCRRSNLRIVTRGQNNQNRDAYRNGKSRFRGVCWDSRRGGWRATAQVNGRWTHIGRFATEEEAAEAASDWRRAHMPFSFEEAVAA